MIIFVGRAPDVELCIDDASVSRRHAVVHIGQPVGTGLDASVEMEDDVFILRDVREMIETCVK